MKKLLLKLVFFSIVLLSFLSTYYYSVNKIISNNVEFIISEDSKNVIFGHSHAETAVNDSLVSNTTNLAKSGESYFYIYPKVVKIIEQNPNIERVFIEFTNNQVSKSINEWIWGRKYVSSKYLTYSPFITLDNQTVIFKNNAPIFLTYFPISIKENSKRVFSNDYYYSKYQKFGGYNFYALNKTDSLIQALNNNPPKSIESDKISEINLNYLEKIITLCRSKNKQVILFRTPQHKLNPEQFNEETFQDILKSRFGDLEFLDFNYLNINNNEFGDLGHLNYQGARIFSIWLDFLFGKGLLLTKDKSSFARNMMSEFSEFRENSFDNLYNSKLIENKELLFKKVLQEGHKIEKEHQFLEGLTTKEMIIFSDSKARYVILSIAQQGIEEILKDKAFGIHGETFDKDYNNLPSWVKSKNSNRITWKSDIELYNDKHIFLTFKKDSDIDDFKKLRLFLMNKTEYSGTIGLPYEHNNLSFTEGYGLNIQMDSIEEKSTINIRKKSLNIQHKFSEELKINGFVYYSDEDYNYLDIEYQDPYPEDFLRDKAFGVQGLSFDSDYEKLPDWVKQKEGMKFVTWKSIPELRSLNEKNYLTVKFEKNTAITKWKTLRLFLINREEYKGTIGFPIELTNINFE